MKIAPKMFNVGPFVIGSAMATDGGWDWTSDNGDRHRDVMAIVILRRLGAPPLLRLTLGPIFVGVLLARLR